MIRQAISCDICGAEKKQTNHWFVASEQAGELRVSGWSARNKLRPGTKHLCGQTCLHKLVDEFMAGTLAGRFTQPVAEPAPPPEPLADIDASLTSKAAFVQSQPAARPDIKPVSLVPLRPAAAVAAVVVPLQARPEAGEKRPVAPAPCIEDAPNYASRRWHAEAWERERERELRAGERRSESSLRRRIKF